MRRLLSVLLVLLALAVAATAAARDPRQEQLRLNATDNALAKRIAVKQSDVGATWQKRTLPASQGQLSCPGFNPDLSRFTITGRALTAFSQATGASIASAVDVFKSRADAAGDFRAAATPTVARCLRLTIERQFGGGAVPLRVRSSRVVAAPRVGDRRIAYRVVAAVTTGAAALNVYLDVVVVQKGRSIAAIFFTAPLQPLPSRKRVAAAVASRMR
jgi:hypothetical protein